MLLLTSVDIATPMRTPASKKNNISFLAYTSICSGTGNKGGKGILR